MTHRLINRGPRRRNRVRSRGQALALFALFLLVLLGASALAIDYANWLLIDRRLQNVSDHAALAGAAMFDQSSQQTSCGSNPALCQDARAQAWKSLSDDLSLNLEDTTIGCLAQRDTPVGGYKDAGDSPDSCTGAPFGGHTLWVSTPPPDNASYTGVGGRYALNHAVVFARVDEPTRSYLAGVFGIVARDRIGWATAGPLPTDFALQVFCRNGVAPQSGACGGSGATALVIDGQGGIQLIRGDIGSNESLKVTATNGGGVTLNSGRMFLVNGTCSNALWRCPNGPPSLGGLSDGAPNYNGQNAFYMPPQPVPHFASPLDDVGVPWSDCQGASINSFCVPAYRPVGASRSQSPGDWTCDDPIANPTSANPCGEAVVVGSSVSCKAYLPLTFNPSRDLVPYKDGVGANVINGVPINSNNQKWQNVDDNPLTPDPDTNTPPANPPSDYVYLQNNLNSGSNRSFTFVLRPPFGIPDAGQPTTINYVAFKTNGSALDDTGNQVDVAVTVLQQGTVIWGPVAAGSALTATPQRFSFQVPSGMITNYNALSLQFTFSSPSGGVSSSRRGGGISWAEAQTPPLSDALPPMIWPGYYHSITIPPEHAASTPTRWCGLLDPTAIYRIPGAGSNLPGLQTYQKPGIYRFGPDASSTIDIGNGSFLIGDGVTLVFDPGFPNPSSNGLKIGADAALVLNTMRVPGSPPCTPSETEATTYNPSSIDQSDANKPLKLLPYSSVCAAWTVDVSTNSGLHPGLMAWPIPETELAGTNQCGDPLQAQPVLRTCYEINPTPSTYRGITFYFSTSNWPATTVRGRFQMSAGGGNCDGSQPGIAFRGVLYAPYDDVIITGGSNFGAVGQILAWTVKFNGACPSLVLDYPYQSEPAPPYLLEPGLGQ